MDTRLLKILAKLGLKQNQAKVYLAILELGEGTVQEIAKKAGLKRTTIYTLADELKNAGFLYETKSKKKIFFSAEDPADILKRLKGRLNLFESKLEIFNSLRRTGGKKPRTFFLDGGEGFKKIWQFILRPETKEFLIITDPREMLGFVRKGYITGKIIREKVRLGIKSRQLIASSEYAKEIIAKDHAENRASKVLPHIYKIPFTTIIFGDKVALISPQKENMILLIESEEFAKTQKALFEALWDFLPLSQGGAFQMK